MELEWNEIAGEEPKVSRVREGARQNVVYLASTIAAPNVIIIRRNPLFVSEAGRACIAAVSAAPAVSVAAAATAAAASAAAVCAAAISSAGT
jgi:hypothetical protein